MKYTIVILFLLIAASIASIAHRKANNRGWTGLHSPFVAKELDNIKGMNR